MSDRREELGQSLAAVERRLSAACAATGRDRSELTLVAVTKTHPASDVAHLAALGVRDVGESRDQEAAPKATQLAALPLRWHLVGRLQRNKARSVATWASEVHSVDRAPVVAALSDGAVRAGRRIGALLQVSLDGDPARGGAVPADVPALADAVAAADGLVLRGVMAVAPLGASPDDVFRRLADVAEQLRRAHPGATWISAGMSGDLEAAVAHGATHVRIGTALLGHRPARGR